jgi:Ca-activated chloride channel family protein
MSFLAPSRLLLLLAVVALAALYVVLQHRRRHYAVRFSNLDLLSSVAPRRPGWRRHVSAAFVGLALTAMVVGLARPTRDEKVPKESAVIMLVVDVSASMDATDVSPTRLQAAADAAARFVQGVPPGFEVGLVAFDRQAQLLATPSTDHATVAAAIEQLRTGPGTATGEGVYTALDAIDVALKASGARPIATNGGASTEKPSATIVLLSDGATTTGRSVEGAAEAASADHVPVNTIAYGTPNGTVEVDGELVPVPADVEAMRELADATDGSSFTAESAGQLSHVYDDIQAKVGSRTEQKEILRTFFGIGVVALLIATGASLLWNARFL